MENSVGNIVKIRNVIFKHKMFEKHFVIDHAYKKGRPAIVICETENKIYHLLVTSKFHEELGMQVFEIPKNKVVNGFVKLDEIHSRPLCFESEYGEMNPEYLLDILINFCNYQDQISSDDEYEEIKPYVYKKICELSRSREKR